MLESAKCNLTHGDRLNPKDKKQVGRPQEQIAQNVGLSRNRISEIVGNTIFGNTDNLLSQGRDMDYIAEHYNMDLALAWSLRLEEKADQEKYKELGWELRTQSCFDGHSQQWNGRFGPS